MTTSLRTKKSQPRHGRPTSRRISKRRLIAAIVAVLAVLAAGMTMYLASQSSSGPAPAAPSSGSSVVSAAGRAAATVASEAQFPARTVTYRSMQAPLTGTPSACKTSQNAVTNGKRSIKLVWWPKRHMGTDHGAGMVESYAPHVTNHRLSIHWLALKGLHVAVAKAVIRTGSLCLAHKMHIGTEKYHGVTVQRIEYTRGEHGKYAWAELKVTDPKKAKAHHAH